MKFRDSIDKKADKFFKYPDNLKRIEEKVLYRLQSFKKELDITSFPSNLFKIKSEKIENFEKSTNLTKKPSLTTHKDTINYKLEKSTTGLVTNHLKDESKNKSFLDNSNSDTLNVRKSSISILKDSKLKEFEQSLKKHAKVEFEEQRKIRRKVIKILRDYSQCKRYCTKTENFNERILNQYEYLSNEISHQEIFKKIRSPYDNRPLVKNPKSIITDLKTIFSEKPPIEVVLSQTLDKNELSLLKIDSKFYKKNNKNIFDNNNQIFTNSSLLSKIENEDEENVKKKILIKAEKQIENKLSKFDHSPLKQLDKILKEINNQAYKKTFIKNLKTTNTSELMSILNNSRLNGSKSDVNIYVKYGKNLEPNQLRKTSLEYNKQRNLKISEFTKEIKSKNTLNDIDFQQAMNNIFEIKNHFIEQNKNFQNYKKLWRLERNRLITTESS